MTRRFSVDRLTGAGIESTNDVLSVEEPLLVVIDGKPFATLMRTPGEDQELVEGFLFAESIVSRPSDIASIRLAAHPTSQEMHVQLAPGRVAEVPAARSIYLSSSCGVCGRASIEDLLERIAPIPALEIDMLTLVTLADKLSVAQKQFAATGGVHAAGLFSAAGELMDVAEDVGRHNALDKLVGRQFRASQLPLHGRVLVMSSRASFDIVQKAAMAGIPVVATMGAASSLAADLAARAGIRLHCFLRPHSVVRIRSNE